MFWRRRRRIPAAAAAVLPIAAAAGLIRISPPAAAPVTARPPMVGPAPAAVLTPVRERFPARLLLIIAKAPGRPFPTLRFPVLSPVRIFIRSPRSMAVRVSLIPDTVKITFGDKEKGARMGPFLCLHIRLCFGAFSRLPRECARSSRCSRGRRAFWAR